MLGATLGGGVGRYQGLHGMILDSLLSVRMVTGTGDIVTASATQNPELFWGMRGAGFNYGIVVSATYRIYDLTAKNVMNADMIFPASASDQLWDALKNLGVLPAKLAIAVIVTFSEPLNAVGQQLFRPSWDITLFGAHPFVPDNHLIQRCLRRPPGRRPAPHPANSRPPPYRPEHLDDSLERRHRAIVLQWRSTHMRKGR
jgi:hypothetical protein